MMVMVMVIEAFQCTGSLRVPRLRQHPQIVQSKGQWG